MRALLEHYTFAPVSEVLERLAEAGGRLCATASPGLAA